MYGSLEHVDMIHNVQFVVRIRQRLDRKPRRLLFTRCYVLIGLMAACDSPSLQ